MKIKNVAEIYSARIDSREIFSKRSKFRIAELDYKLDDPQLFLSNGDNNSAIKLNFGMGVLSI